MISGLLFDCDGVLADSEPLNHRCWSETFHAQLGAPLPDDPAAIVGLDLERIYVLGCNAAGRCVDSLDADTRAALLAQKSRLFRAYAPAALHPVRGARELVAAARASGLPTAVVSSALRARLAHTLELLGLAAGWHAVLAGEDMIPGCPPTKDWARAASLLGLAPARCAAIDDSAEGVASARTAGIGCIVGVATGVPAARLWAAGAHHVVPGPWAIDLDRLHEEASCASL